MSQTSQAAASHTEQFPTIKPERRPSRQLEAIKTDRLILREFVIEDVAAFHTLESTPSVVRYQTWPPRTLEQAHKEVTAIIENSTASPRLHVELAVLHDDVFIGRVGTNIRLPPVCRADDPAERGLAHADLWFSFMPSAQRRGFATEAMCAFVPLLGSLIELEIECDPRNVGSVRMAERLGFERFSLVDKAFECKGEWVGSLVFRKVVGEA